MFVILHRRRREQRTNFKKRLALIKSGKTRVVIRKTLSGVKIQFIDYDPKGDVTVASAVSQELKKMGWNYSLKNIPASYLTGLLAGKRAAEKNVTEAVLDLGLQTATKGSKLYAALKGIVDSGLNVPHSAEILPSEDRLSGKHIQNVKADEIKNKMEELKEKILG